MEISHKEFVMILAAKRKYEKMKENVKNVSKKQENMRLNSKNSKKYNKFVNNLCLVLLVVHFCQSILNTLILLNGFT